MILAATRKKHAAEIRQMTETETVTLNRAWVGKALEEVDCGWRD